ncbi:flavin reductase [Microbaculum marinum]|uniref:flavin reductase n=1 Tax=Microbaculum marinum TaxID=1764581 RepID=UPI00361A6203
MDTDAFRRALGHFSTGVTVITADAGGSLAGITANSFNSVSLDPPLILWSVKKTSTSWPVFAAARSFAVNVLAVGQSTLAAQFARSGTDKFSGVGWRHGASGAPLLDDVTARFECERRYEYEGGDHLIVVGEVTRFSRFDRRPLVFTQGRFSVAIDHEEIDQAVAAASAEDRPTFLTMLRRAFLHRASEFREEAHAVGFTMNQSRLSYHLAVSPGLTLENLARVALLDVDAAKDGVSALEDRGWIGRRVDGTLELTSEGRRQNVRLGEVARSAEAAKLAGYTAAEIEIARRVIASLGGRLDNIPDYGEDP